MSVSNEEQAHACLGVLGRRYREDWSDFDGKTLRYELADVSSVLKGDMTYAEFSDRNIPDWMKS